MQKVLFICSRNLRRSLTAERLYAHSRAVQARSAGTQPGARIVVTAGHLGWADLIVCMEKRHLRQLQERFPEAMHGKRTLCLHLPDNFQPGEPALIEELCARLEGHLPVPA